jgi:hypothetical protein
MKRASRGTSLGVQFCDVLAGLAARQFSPATLGDDREFMDRLVGNGFSELVYNGIRPDIVFPDQIPPRRLQGPDAVDRLMRVMYSDRRTTE